MTDELAGFARGATDAMGFTEAEYEPPDDEFEPDDVEADDDGGEGDDSSSDDVLGALSDAFWASLDPATRAAAVANEDHQGALWEAWLADRGVTLTDPDDEPTVGAQSDWAPETAHELVEAALSGRFPLEDRAGNPLSPGEYLDALASMSESEWRQAARAVGYTGERPSYALLGQYGRSVEGAVQAASWQRTLDNLDAENEQRERDGRPPRYLGQ